LGVKPIYNFPNPSQKRATFNYEQVHLGNIDTNQALEIHSKCLRVYQNLRVFKSEPKDGEVRFFGRLSSDPSLDDNGPKREQALLERSAPKNF
jgi:hypothetical protein